MSDINLLSLSTVYVISADEGSPMSVIIASAQMSVADGGRLTRVYPYTPERLHPQQDNRIRGGLDPCRSFFAP